MKQRCVVNWPKCFVQSCAVSAAGGAGVVPVAAVRFWTATCTAGAGAATAVVAGAAGGGAAAGASSFATGTGAAGAAGWIAGAGGAAADPAGPGRRVVARPPGLGSAP